MCDLYQGILSGDYFAESNIWTIEERESHLGLIPLSEDKKHKIFITCEHASNRLPDKWQWSPQEEKELTKAHWAVDIGAARLASKFAKAFECPLLLCKFSRLLIDANRNLESPGLFRTMCDGVPVALNTNMTKQDRDTRINEYWAPYQSFAKSILNSCTELKFVLLVHSFTPNYEGNPRSIEIGILYEVTHPESTRIANILLDKLKPSYDARLNEPYTGSLSSTYSPPICVGALERNIPFVALEVRQDLATNFEWADKLTSTLVSIFNENVLS